MIKKKKNVLNFIADKEGKRLKLSQVSLLLREERVSHFIAAFVSCSRQQISLLQAVSRSST